MQSIFSKGWILVMVCAFVQCQNKESSNEEMRAILESIHAKNEVPSNSFSSSSRISYYDSLLRLPAFSGSLLQKYKRASAYLEAGREEEAIEFFQEVLDILPEKEVAVRNAILKDMAVAWMRVGERTNCIRNHSTASCIFPIQGTGIHKDKFGSKNAIDILEALLKENPKDHECKWLLNIAYMTVNGYPHKVPKEYLLKLAEDSSQRIKPFIDAAFITGLNTHNLAGGSIVEDFDNDGFLDVVTSSMHLNEGMHYCRNNGNGTFSDISVPSGVQGFTGGLQIMQTDYNNDGLKDIFVTRGGWKMEYGKEPNSLLRNNGDGTFTDVTKQAGLLSFFPTQTAVWADFNNDGWLDLYIGNEPFSDYQLSPCELYINNRNGTFTEAAATAGVGIAEYVKGVNAGDYNNDGHADIIVSTITGKKFLFMNTGRNKNGVPVFTDVSFKARIAQNRLPSFSTWFFDYNNDGWLDIVICAYHFEGSLAVYAAAEAEGHPVGGGQPLLFENNRDGTFTEVTTQVGLNKCAFAMGSNFGDIDNDGFLDFFLGTGNPRYSSLIPNKLFRNKDGKSFEDVTTPARVGNLQKGHGVSFADLDNDGDEDIYMDLGGAYEGDGYQNPLYINPGQNDNSWIKLSLKGVRSNAVAIGARIKVTIKENGQLREIHRVVSSGSSFGANPLMQHIGIGKAERIESVEIDWPATGIRQVFRQLAANTLYEIVEGEKQLKEKELVKLDFLDPNRTTVGCAPL